MQLDLTDEETAALLAELNAIIENDRFSLSSRIRSLRSIRAKFPTASPEPPPARPPTPEERDRAGLRDCDRDGEDDGRSVAARPLPARESTMAHHRGDRGSMGRIVLVLAAIGVASQPAVALDNAYLHCEGAITIFYKNSHVSLEKQQIAAHIIEDRITFSGNTLLLGTDIQICRPSMDEFYFDSQSCKGGSVDFSRPREFGTLNKITGELNLANESPRLAWRLRGRGTFICKRAEPVIK